MEQFLVIQTVTDQHVANLSCGLLEDASIPVMLEHVTISEGTECASGYRILVPSDHIQTALGLLGRISASRTSAYSTPYVS
ncbi:MAG: hypothetical protein KDD55_01485 [Bdellovibrionales bacterium]|nr:hypothetical protein [Bdellovibrionales bacterium]